MVQNCVKGLRVGVTYLSVTSCEVSFPGLVRMWVKRGSTRVPASTLLGWRFVLTSTDGLAGTVQYYG